MPERWYASRADRLAVRESFDRIASVSLQEAPSAQATADALATELGQLVSTYAAVFRPERTPEGWSFEFIGTNGLSRDQMDTYLGGAGAASKGMFTFDPLHPAPSMRNALRTTTWVDHAREAPAAHAAFTKMGIDRAAQSRVLVCDGPVLLAWVGVCLPDGPSLRAEWMVRRLALGARRLLRSSHALRKGDRAAALDVAFEALAIDAYIIKGDGRVEWANSLGSHRLREDPGDVLADLSRATRSEPSSFDLRPIHGRGIPSLFLAMRSAMPLGDTQARLELARRNWRLTPREVEVLRCLAHGDANKDIANRLGIRPRTVEVHVNALMAKARVESRLRLIARLWHGP